MRSRIGTVAALLSMLLLFLAGSDLWAGERDHEDGFFLRLSGGGGGAGTSVDVLGSNFEMSGASGDINLAIGAIVAPNLALHGTVFGWLVSDPDVKFAGASGSANADLGFNAIGGGLTYYFMPVNIYLSGSLGVGNLTVDSGSVSAKSEAGLGMDFTAGKEWWVSSKWALGVAGGFNYHSIADKDLDHNWSGTSFALRFTATMN
jgi:hypothetical protein